MAEYEFCKVVLLEQREKEKIYGVIDVRFPKLASLTHGAIKERQKKHMQNKFFLFLIQNING